MPTILLLFMSLLLTSNSNCSITRLKVKCTEMNKVTLLLDGDTHKDEILRLMVQSYYQPLTRGLTTFENEACIQFSLAAVFVGGVSPYVVIKYVDDYKSFSKDLDQIQTLWDFNNEPLIDFSGFLDNLKLTQGQTLVYFSLDHRHYNIIMNELYKAQDYINVVLMSVSTLPLYQSRLPRHRNILQTNMDIFRNEMTRHFIPPANFRQFIDVVRNPKFDRNKYIENIPSLVDVGCLQNLTVAFIFASGGFWLDVKLTNLIVFLESALIVNNKFNNITFNFMEWRFRKYKQPTVYALQQHHKHTFTGNSITKYIEKVGSEGIHNKVFLYMSMSSPLEKLTFETNTRFLTERRFPFVSFELKFKNDDKRTRINNAVYSSYENIDYNEVGKLMLEALIHVVC